MQPASKILNEHFALMQKQWQDSVDRLRCIVDANIDKNGFIRACEYSILKDTHKVEIAYAEQNNYNIVMNASNIARRANRILQIATQEADNSEDSVYVEQINLASNALKSSPYIWSS
jgi:vinculin